MKKRLNGKPVDVINSMLRPNPERADPVALKSNSGLSFLGSKVYGQGFTLAPEERDELVVRDKRNKERIFPYLGGREVNSTPNQTFHRYVINFGQMELEETEEWPDLLAIVREKVKPERDKVRGEAHKRYWWHYARKRPALYEAISGLERCLVTTIVTKHLIFSFQPLGRIFAHALCLFPLEHDAHFALLQSRIHEPWVWLLSSTMKTDLHYSASKCFETFPFPPSHHLHQGTPLDLAGQTLYETRAAYMIDTQQGLTQTYNLLKDPTNTDPKIQGLRLLHEEVDLEVLRAYGWSDLEVPPYGTPDQAFEDGIIDRLYALNQKQAHVPEWDAEVQYQRKRNTGKAENPDQAGSYLTGNTLTLVVLGLDS